MCWIECTRLFLKLRREESSDSLEETILEDEISRNTARYLGTRILYDVSKSCWMNWVTTFPSNLWTHTKWFCFGNVFIWYVLLWNNLEWKWFRRTRSLSKNIAWNANIPTWQESSTGKASWQGNEVYETCEYSKCWNTVDREELSRADAVWFYCANLPEEDDVYPELWNDTAFPKRVYSCLESPIFTKYSSKNTLKRSHRVFDWTMTLNKDSTIVRSDS